MYTMIIPYILPSSIISDKYTGIMIRRRSGFKCVNSSWYTSIMKTKGFLVIDEDNLSSDADKYIKIN